MSPARQHLPDPSAGQDQNKERVGIESQPPSHADISCNAAAHPLAPSAAETALAALFTRDFSAVFPCAPRAALLREIVLCCPLDAVTDPKFATWMCKAHKDANNELGKDVLPCDADSPAKW
jgi:hypothetical protein